MLELYISSPQMKEISLELKRDITVVDVVTFEFNRNLDTLLIQGVDNLLKKNKMDIQSLDNVVIDEHIDKDSSLFKILETFRIGLKN